MSLDIHRCWMLRTDSKCSNIVSENTFEKDFRPRPPFHVAGGTMEKGKKMAHLALAAPVQLPARPGRTRTAAAGTRPRAASPQHTRPAEVRPQAGVRGHLRLVPDPAPARRAAAPAPRLRLTRRGRFVLIGLPTMLGAAALLVLAGIFTAPVMASGTAAADAVQGQTVTVLDGETLWGLAAELAPERDPRDVVAEIIEVNNLATSRLEPGQRIFIPSGS
jgi:hypothetical protein